MPDDPVLKDSLQAENAQLRLRIAELEQRLQAELQRVTVFQTQIQDMQHTLAHYESSVAQLQTEARQQQTLLQLIVDQMPQVICWKDRSGRYLGGNRQMYNAAAAATPAEIIGKTDYDMPWADRAEEYIADDQAVMASGVSQLNYEVPVRQSDGRTVYVSSSRIPWVQNGTVLGLVTIAEDITRRKLEQEQLRVFRDIVHSTPVPIGKVPLQADPRLDYVNPAHCQLLGYTPDELIGMPLVQEFAEDSDYIMSLFALCLEQGVWQGEIRYRHKDGSTIPAYLTANVLYDETGVPYSVVGFVRDLRQQKQQEAQLRTFQLLVESTPDAVIITDHTERIIYANPAAESMLGYPPSVVGRTGRSIIYAEDQDHIAQLVTQTLARGYVYDRIRYIRGNGEVTPIQLSGFLLRDEEGQPMGFASISRDLTEEQRAAAERQALQAQIIAAQQAMVRELSTPLMPIADGVVVIPIIGSVDSQRAQAIMETTLEGITAHTAEVVILDITGVRVVDAQVAGALMRTAQAAQLLGIEVVLTGISAKIAQTLVQIGANLGHIVTQSSLQQGITYAIERRQASGRSRGGFSHYADQS